MEEYILEVLDFEEDDTSTHGLDQEDGGGNAPDNAGEPYQSRTKMEEEDDDDDCTDDDMAMQVREEGAMAKVSKYLVPESVRKFFRLGERQSYFALATFISKVMGDYYISIMVIFLTDDLNMKPIPAAIIKTSQDGCRRALAIFMAYLTNVYVGDFLMLFLSALLYSLVSCFP